MAEQYSVEQIKELIKDDDRVQLAGQFSLLSLALIILEFTRLSPTGVDMDGILRGKFMNSDKFKASLDSGQYSFASLQPFLHPPSSFLPHFLSHLFANPPFPLRL